MIKIVVAGFKGRMGTAATQMVLNEEDFELVGVLDPSAQEANLAEINQYDGVDVPVFTSKEALVAALTADVWIDFTIPAVALENIRFALENRIRPVVGTTGLSEGQINELKELAQAQQVGGLIAPNFAIGAVLMMEFAQKAAAYFPDVEVIELHHDQKLDAPSGTAIKTVELMAQTREEKRQGHPAEEELLPGARGADYQGMKIHSVRLPGLVAHQEVLFGAPGEGLTLRHDSYDRQSFMTGVALGCRKVMPLTELVYGLDQLL